LTTAPPPEQQPLAPGLLFACVLGLLVAGTAALWALRPDLGHDMNISRVAAPSDDHFLAYDGSGNLEHHVLYFGLDGQAIAHLREADVLLLGNSRLMFAARPGVLDRFFDARGLQYFVLGFGYREADRFPLAIIEKFDLRPRYVVVNADGFFSDAHSEMAEQTMRDSYVAAERRRLEGEASHQVRRALHRLVPNWVDLFGRAGFPWRREVIGYRSRVNGTWQVFPWEEARAGVEGRDLRAPALSPTEVSAAERFESAMNARGASVILTYVPTPRPLGGGPMLFAEHLDVPLIADHPLGMGSHDGDHLDANSAVVWSESLVRGLEDVIR